MNIQDYISSGNIELYVLGLTSKEETEKIEELALQYPEIREAIDSYERTMESYVDLHAVNPSTGLKTKIIGAIEQQKELEDDSTSEPEKAAAVYSIKRWKRFAIAAAVLFLTSLLLNVIYINKYRETRESYSDLLASQQQTASNNQLIKTRLDKAESDLQLLMNPSVKPVIMKGVEKHPDFVATVYWDPTKRVAYFGNSNLPEPPSGKEYQLWAIIDGQPVDMGMYDPGSNLNLVEMKKAKEGTIQAFAVTLEKKGGSPAPTMDQMYVMGNV